MSLVIGLVSFLLVAVLPGAVFFRAPLLHRDRRERLPAEERCFWQIVLSVVWSVGVALVMGAASRYSFSTLLGINGGLAVLGLVAWRSRLRMPAAPRPAASSLLPLAILALALFRFLPASEYIVGGKDPGVYVNEGISLHRTGTIFRHDAVVAAVPTPEKDLFFHDYPPTEYYGVRFMGVFLNDPDTGEVIPQFPHFLPASFALGYGVGGVRGAATTVVVWACLGLLAVYFFGVRLAGRAPAFLACLLLALNVIEVWYGRYPNAEVVMQALVFAGLLAFSYSIKDDDRYFGWVTGAFAAALIFLRFDSYLAIAPVAGAAALLWIVERRSVGWGAALLLVVASAIAWQYYRGPMQAYFWMYRENLPAVGTGVLLVGGAIGLTYLAGLARGLIGPPLKTITPPVLVLAIAALTIYVLFFRRAGGRLTDYNAYSLQSFRDLYVYWPALLTGLAGFALVTWKRFWKEPAFFLLFAAFSVFFFYKIRVPPENFWLARRFLPVILPGLLLLASAGAFGVLDSGERRRLWRTLAATVLLGFIGWQFAGAAAPVAAHVEYRGAIPAVAQFADRISDRDLVLFESRESDMHVYALPLAYAYGKQVLVLESPRPDRRKMESLLGWAAQRYQRVLFVASAGTDLLSQRIVGIPVACSGVTLPEYATSNWNEFPAGARQKDLSYCIYQLSLGTADRRGFVLDVGTLDDLHVLRFQSKETTENRTFRWTGPQSFVAITGLTGSERELALVMHDGGRPAIAPPARVELFLAGTSIGSVDVGKGFQEYRIAIPPGVIQAAATGIDPAELRIVSTTWAPKDYLGGTDNRALGVMIDRIEIH